MRSIAEEMISRYADLLWNPSLLLAAAVSVFMLVSGLAAKIIEFGQTIVLVFTDRDGGTRPPARLGPASPRLWGTLGPTGHTSQRTSV